MNCTWLNRPTSALDKTNGVFRSKTRGRRSAIAQFRSHHHAGQVISWMIKSPESTYCMWQEFKSTIAKKEMSQNWMSRHFPEWGSCLWAIWKSGNKVIHRTKSMNLAAPILVSCIGEKANRTVLLDLVTLVSSTYEGPSNKTCTFLFRAHV